MTARKLHTKILGDAKEEMRFIVHGQDIEDFLALAWVKILSDYSVSSAHELAAQGQRNTFIAAVTYAIDIMVDACAESPEKSFIVIDGEKYRIIADNPSTPAPSAASPHGMKHG